MSSKKSIFKLSRREEREYRQVQAAKRRNRLTAENRASEKADRWAELRARLDAQLVLFNENDRWLRFSVSVRVDPDYCGVAAARNDKPRRLKRNSKKLTAQARKNMAVFERDNFTCRDCFKEFDHPEPYRGETIPGLTRGHIIPAAQGGTTATVNLIAQCQPCNQALGNQVWDPGVLTVPEWMGGGE